MGCTLKDQNREHVQTDPSDFTVREENPSTWDTLSVSVGAIGAATDVGANIDANTVAIGLNNVGTVSIVIGPTAAVNNTLASADAGEVLDVGAKKTIAIKKGSAFPLFAASTGAGGQDLRVSLFKLP